MVVLGLLTGCNSDCDDRCHAERAEQSMATDMGRAIAEVRAIEDPVVRTAVIMAAVRQPALRTTPQQAIELCDAAPNAATRTHCENRFLRPHLQSGPPPR